MEPAPKLRPAPQRKGNVGAGRRYTDEAAYLADRAACEQERNDHIAG